MIDTAIKQKDVDRAGEWFSLYVGTFKYGSEKLRHSTILKEEHSLRVRDEIEDIGRSLQLDRNELQLAGITALLHDIGRFEQFARYGTFEDARSEDHAGLGVKILRRYGILEGFGEHLSELMLGIIGYHNKAALPENETETCLFFSRLLRDADKLDIYRVVSDHYSSKDKWTDGLLEFSFSETPGISDDVYQDIVNHRIVDFKHVNNLNDFKLLQIGWIFDINFDHTLRSLVSRGYLEVIRSLLPDSEQIGEIFAVTDSYINSRFEKKSR